MEFDTLTFPIHHAIRFSWKKYHITVIASIGTSLIKPSGSIKTRNFGSVDNPGVDTGLNAGIAAQSYFDVAGSYNLTDGITLDAGIRNVFAKEPPLIGDSLKGTEVNANTFAGYYDTLGRYLHANITSFLIF